MRHEPNTAFHSQDITPTVKHDGGVMLWGCFAASGLGLLAIIEGTRNSVPYLIFFKEKVQSSVCELKLN